jgi:capsid portal protein
MMGFEPIPRFSRERILSPLRLPFRHIGVQANLTHGSAQTKRFSIYDQLRQGSRNFL